MSKVKAVVLGMIVLAADVLAGPKTLIELDGDKPVAALAKSWKKVKDGQYKFQLDTTKEVAKGAPVTAEAVKSSLEAKLGVSKGVTVKADSAAEVTVSYTGDEKSFLESVAKAKIRSSKDVELAMESSVSAGGIRAKKADRPADADEVKLIAIKIDAGVITGKVNDSKNAKVKAGEIVKIKGEIKDLKKNESFFFKPSAKEGDVWQVQAGSLQK